MTLFPGEKLAKMTKAIASRWQTLGWALEWALEHRTQLITYSEWCAKELDHADLFKKEWIVMFNWLNSPTMMFEASLVNDICQWFIHPEFAWSQSASWREYSTGRAGCRLLEMPLRSFRRFHMIWIARTYFEQTALCYLHDADPRTCSSFITCDPYILQCTRSVRFPAHSLDPPRVPSAASRWGERRTAEPTARLLCGEPRTSDAGRSRARGQPLAADQPAYQSGRDPPRPLGHAGHAAGGQQRDDGAEHDAIINFTASYDSELF